LLFIAILTTGFTCCMANDVSTELIEENKIFVKTFIVDIDGDYYPLSFINEDDNPAGFDVESILWIADEIGFEVVFKPIAWDQIIAALLVGDVNMIDSV